MVKEMFGIEAYHEDGSYEVVVYVEDGCVFVDQLGETMLVFEREDWLDLCKKSLESWDDECDLGEGIPETAEFPWTRMEFKHE